MRPPDLSELIIDVPGGGVFTRRWSVPGSQRSPLLLLHDSLGSVEQWRDFPAALAVATSRSVIAYDRLGFGKSSPRVERPSPGFIEEEAVVVVPALLEALGIERFVPFGHSVGGGMALTIAARHGARCEAVISEAAQAFVEPLTLTGIREAQRQFADPAQQARLVRWHGDKAPWVLDAWTQVWLSPAFRDWTLDHELERITCPVLAIHGEHDEYGSLAFPRRIAGGVKGPARLAILPCGHVPHRDQGDEVLRLVADFLSMGSSVQGGGA